jgi:hypothetical protein
MTAVLAAVLPISDRSITTVRAMPDENLSPISRSLLVIVTRPNMSASVDSGLISVQTGTEGV